MAKTDSTPHFNTTHGMRWTCEYSTWLNMRQRCSNPKRVSYEHYGGRGITVDPRWESFEQFFADMGSRPEGTTLERIDNDGPYSPENCRWATMKEQCANRRIRKNARYLTHDGITLPLADWARRVGMNPDTISKRIDLHGWSVGKALTSPVG